jgi:hypothetical protein
VARHVWVQLDCDEPVSLEDSERMCVGVFKRKTGVNGAS